MSGEQVTLSIDGVEVSVPKGTTILDAAKQAGVVVPHYCYHPGLPVAGVCRMCLVKVEGAPKLMIGCATQAQEGQVVEVFHEEATDARKSVLEFLLINHPLDCPICDQAGECELQDYVFQEGRSRTRYADYAKRFNPVEDFGDDILYVPNRCILCTRCVRFMEHVAEEDVLNVSERGDRAVIGIHPEARLNHVWAGNVVDLCPVGSLISKDFLHKARAWELDKTPSVCTGCSQGCNINIDTRANVVVRLRPRQNEAVNAFFMCDEGRASYRWLNHGDRAEAPLVRENGSLVASDWDHALARAAQIVKGSSGQAAVIASPNASNEALYLLATLTGDFDSARAFSVRRVPGEQPLAGVPNLALREERAANASGARLFGFEERFHDVLTVAAEASLVVVLDDPLEGVGGGARNGLGQGMGYFIYIGTTLPQAARDADVVLPIANVAEEDGTFLNRDMRVQRYFQAKTPPGMARPAWWVLGELLAELGKGQALQSAAEVFDTLAQAVGAFSGLDYAMLHTVGAQAADREPAGAGAEAVG